MLEDDDTETSCMHTGSAENMHCTDRHMKPTPSSNGQSFTTDVQYFSYYFNNSSSQYNTVLTPHVM